MKPVNPTYQKKQTTFPDYVFVKGISHIGKNNVAALHLVVSAFDATDVDTENNSAMVNGQRFRVRCFMNDAGAMILNTKAGTHILRGADKPQTLPMAELPWLVVRPIDANRITVYQIDTPNSLIPFLGENHVPPTTVTWANLESQRTATTLLYR